ncbi:MAG: DUF3187 family protein [Gemmatimonadales bacterium]
MATLSVRCAARARSHHRFGLLLGLLLLPVRDASAQGLPAWAPVNPAAASRSGLTFQPYVDPAPGRWRASVQVDYGSAIEYNLPSTERSWLFDAEVMRIGLGVVRDLGPSTFALAELPLLGAYDGFLDGFLEWYHDLFGIAMPERDARPRNAFAYQLTTPSGTGTIRGRSGLFPGDLRLGLGYRYNSVLQTVGSVTLPTSIGPEGYGRGTVSVNAVTTLRAPFSSRFTYEGSLGVGFTPSDGELADLQRELFLSATSGLRFRFWGRQSLFANLLYHSPYYEDVMLPALDRRELSLDFGWILATGGGREWRIGMVEDLEPSGPGIDLVFRLGANF